MKVYIRTKLKMTLYIVFKRDLQKYQENHTNLLNRIDDGEYSAEEAKTYLQEDIEQAIDLKRFANENELEDCIADLDLNITVGKYLTSAKNKCIKILRSIGLEYKETNKNEYLAPAPTPEEAEDEDETKR